MRAAALAALALAAALPASAQPQAPNAPAKLAPGFEQRVYDLAVFMERIADQPGPVLGQSPPAAALGGMMGATFTLEEPRSPGGGAEVLIELIRTNIAEDSWTDKRVSIQAMGEELIVVQTPAVHAKIAQLVAFLRRQTELQIAVEGTVAKVENALLDELRAGAPSPAALSDEAAKALREALAKGERASSLRTVRATARNGQRISLTALTQHGYIQDYDIEVTTAAAACDPIIGYLHLGAVLDIRPLFTRGHLACEVRFSHQTGALPIPSFETGVTGMGRLQLPETALSETQTTVAARDGQTLLVGRIGLADPTDPAAATSLCFFIRPTLVPIEDVPAPASEEKRQMRIFDVGLLTAQVRDFPGPGLQLVPECGAAIMAEDGGREVVSPEALIEAIRHNIAAESWDNTRNSIGVNEGLLYVRQTPDVLDAVKAYLDDLASRRWRMIATRTEVLAVDDTGLRDLQARYPSVAAGVMRLDATEAAGILARAAKGDGLALAASGELAGMNRQRVHVCRANQLAYVRDYDIELASMIAVHDPQVDLVEDGFVMDCRPVLTGDGKTIHAEVRFSYSRLDRPVPLEAVNDKGIRIHRPSVSIARWRTAVVAEAGAWYLLGGGGPVTVGGAERHLLAIVRFVPAP